MVRLETTITVIALIAIIASVGYLSYTIMGLDNRISAIEQDLKPPPQVLTIGTLSVVENIDPGYRLSDVELLLSHLVQQPLLDYQDFPLQIVPSLATEYNFSSDYLTCTLKLRKNVKFSNGMPFNATAVKYTYEREATIPPTAVYQGPVDSANPVTIVDDYTVKINLVSPMPLVFPNFLAIGFGNSIVYPGANDTNAFKIGTGPYYISEWKKGEYTTLSRNENYWGPKPKLDQIIFREYKDSAALRLSLVAGEVDMARTMYQSLELQDIQALQNNPEIVSKELAGLTVRNRFFYINQKFPPLNNTLVRQAIAYAIDKDRILQVGYKGNGKLSQGVIPSLMSPYYVPAWNEYYPTNKDKARALLAQAGYPNGFKTEFWWSTVQDPLDRDVALLIQDDLRQVGIDVEIKTAEYSTWKKIRIDPGMPMCLQGFTIDYPDPASPIGDMLCNFGYYSPLFHYNDSSLSELGKIAVAEGNQTQRVAEYQEIQQMGADDCPLVPLKESLDRVFYKPYVTGFALPTMEHSEGWILTNVYISSS